MNTLESTKRKYHTNLKVRKEIEANIPAKIIASENKVSKATVYNFQDINHFNKMQGKLVDRIKKAHCLAIDYKNGMTSGEIAEQYNIPKQTVLQILEAMGLTKEHGGRTIRSQQVVERIVTLHKEGKGVYEISSSLNLGLAYIYTVVKAKGLSFKTDELELNVLELNKQDKTQSEIADLLYISQAHVSRILLKHGIRKRPTKQQILEKDNQVLQLHKEGKSQRQIARILDMNGGNVSRILKKHRLKGELNK